MINMSTAADHSGRPRGLRYELSSPAQTRGSCVRGMDVCMRLLCVCVGSGLAMG
jgi:hypothetical protein